ncbi:MAG: FMN-binding protein [Anaerolineae bacterium]
MSTNNNYPPRPNTLSRRARYIGMTAVAAAAIAGIAISQNALGNANVVTAAALTPTKRGAITAATATPSGLYVDGKYDGDVVRASRWGNLQVRAVIENGKLVDVEIIDYPHSRSTSQRINSQAIPWLIEEAVQAQDANIDIITGATPTSEAFIMSLEAALNDASVSSANANTNNSSSTNSSGSVGAPSL